MCTYIAGSTVCTSCDAGKFSAAVGASTVGTCSNCDAGKYSATAGVESVWVCTYIHMNVIRSACSKVILIYRDVKTCTELCVIKSVYIARTHAHTWYASLARWEKYFLFFPSLFHGKNNGWTYLGRNIYVRTYIHAYIHANNFDDECSQ